MLTDTYGALMQDRLDVYTTQMVHHTSAQRNLQCLLAYHVTRLLRLEEVRWSSSGAVLPREVREHLDARETDYFRIYSGAISAYMEDAGGLDLTAVRWHCAAHFHTCGRVDSGSSGVCTCVRCCLRMGPVFFQTLIADEPTQPPSSPPFNRICSRPCATCARSSPWWTAAAS